ncbi:MAG: hypothetical protein ACI976_000888 [Aureispira sp.]|jgi:hypothetical protein
MQEILLDDFENLPKKAKAIDEFFKTYVIFYSISLLASFLLSLFKAPDNTFINILFNLVAFSTLAFHILYFIFLIIKKKGTGRIIVHFLNSFSMLVVAFGFIFYFADWSYKSEMLTTGLVTVPFLLIVQIFYELAVREHVSKYLNIISFLGISTFGWGVLFVIQKWPFGTEMLTVGGLVTLAMTIVHLFFALKKETKYQIHIRYLAQCLFALIIALMIFSSQ